MKKISSLTVASVGLILSAVSAFAQDAETQIQVQSQGSALGGVVGLVIAVIAVVALWKMFTKAGEPGWAAIVPIYNLVVLLKIAGKPLWWIILLIIPFVNIVVGIIVAISLAKAFGKGVGFGVGLIVLPFIFYPILGFGSAAYVGPKSE